MKVTIDNLIRFKDQQERTALQSESYSKRQNIGHSRHRRRWESVWENRDITIQKLKTFMKDGLEMDFDKVPIVDFHRLPQQPLFKLGKRITRPIIVKLAYMKDKTAIYKAVKIWKTIIGLGAKWSKVHPMYTLLITYRALFKNRGRNYSPPLIKHELTSKKLNGKFKTVKTAFT